MKKGFTLVELLGVIIVLGVIAIIVFPNISKAIKNAKEDLYQEQVALIKSSASRWGANHVDRLNTKEIVKLPLIDLVNEGYLSDKEIKDPRSEEDMNGCIVILYDHDYNQYHYEYYDEDCSEVDVEKPLEYTPDKCFAFDSTTGKITDYNEADDDCGIDVVIPDSINGVTVKSIGYRAFVGAYNVSEYGPVCIEPVKYINSVVLPSGLETIENSAFYGGIDGVGYCNLDLNFIESVDFSRATNLKSIGWGAFYGNKLTSVEIPSSVTSIGLYAFKSNQLTSVEIPSSVTSIGDNAFYENQLTSVEIPNSVTSIGSYAFSYNKLEHLTLGSGLKNIDTGVFCANNLSSIVIPSSVNTIGYNAFNDNELSEIIIPVTVTSIGGYAFDNNQLTSVTIKGKSSSADFESYPSSTPFGWAKGYSDSNIIWNG